MKLMITYFSLLFLSKFLVVMLVDAMVIYERGFVLECACFVVVKTFSSFFFKLNFKIKCKMLILCRFLVSLTGICSGGVG